MPVDIDKLAEGWLELESDPGLFTLLLEDFGVREVEVREVYDVSEKIWNEGLGDTRVFGFIFLFRWNPGRNRGRRKLLRNFPAQPVEYVQEKDVINSMFFARQMVQNSCATHALLSVVLNCPDIDLGPTLERLKVHTSGMDPENKGWAIANTPQLARDHNAHASPQAQRATLPVTLTVGGNVCQQVQQSSSGSNPKTSRFAASITSTSTTVSSETFHFVSYVPINGRLYELDGLKPSPIDHGPVSVGARSGGGDWTANFRKVIMSRLGIELESGKVVNQDDDIHFSLMAVIPHQGASLVRKKAKLAQWKTTFDAALDGRGLEEINEEDSEEEEERIAVLRAVIEEYRTSKTEQTQGLSNENESIENQESHDVPSPSANWETLREHLHQNYEEIISEIEKTECAIKEEAEKRNKYRLDDARRAHNYDNFITTFLSMLATEGKLEPLIREQFVARAAAGDTIASNHLANAIPASDNGDDLKLADTGMLTMKRAPLKRVNNTAGVITSTVAAANVNSNRKTSKKKRRGRPTKKYSSKK